MPRATKPNPRTLCLSLPSAASAMDMSLNTLADFITAGEIPLVRLITPAGKEYPRVLWRDLEAFMERYHDRADRLHIAGTRRTA